MVSIQNRFPCTNQLIFHNFVINHSIHEPFRRCEWTVKKWTFWIMPPLQSHCRNINWKNMFWQYINKMRTFILLIIETVITCNFSLSHSVVEAITKQMIDTLFNCVQLNIINELQVRYARLSRFGALVEYCELTYNRTITFFNRSRVKRSCRRLRFIRRGISLRYDALADFPRGS